MSKAMGQGARSLRWWAFACVIVAVSCGPDGSCSVKQPLQVPLNAIVPADVDDQKVAAGSLALTSSVGHDGTARLSVPLWVPPGRAGMEPALGLAYDSRAGNDLVGVGWSLTGLSQIRRCPRNVARDGLAAPVRYDATDALCLDGQRLRLVANKDGQPQATYKTERDDYSKIILDELRDGAAWKFSVYHKDGRVARYGGTDDAVQPANRKGTAVPVAWRLSSVEDRYGNTIAYSYSPVGLGIYPREIAYTGSLRDPQLRPSRFIRFRYDPRPDIETSAAVGLSDLVQRLSAIDVFGPNGSTKEALLRTYRLGYLVDWQNRPASITGRSLLASVTAVDASGASLSPLTFEWERGEHGFEPIATEIRDQYEAARNQFRGFRLIDLNSDGRADLLYLQKQLPNSPDWWGNQPEYVVRLSNGTTFGDPIRLSLPARLDYKGNFSLPMPMLSDSGEPPGLVLWASKDLSQPNEAWPAAARVEQLLVGTKRIPHIGSASFVMKRFSDVVPMDFDGDGLADLVEGWFNSPDDSFQLHRNQPNHVFAAPQPLALPSATANMTRVGFYSPMRGVDVDGDGAQELILCRPTGDDQEGAVISNQGNYTTDLIHCSSALAQPRTPVFFDANGDGLDDVVFPTDPKPLTNNSQELGISLALNQGRGVAAVRTRLKNHHLIGGVRVIDYNQDGHLDLLATRALDYISTTGAVNDNREVRIYTTRTTSAGIELTVALPFMTLPFAGSSPEDFEQIDVGDVDGDGLQDLVALQNNQFVLYRRQGKRPDLLTRAVDGVGAESRFTYQPLTNSAVYLTHHNPANGRYPKREVADALLVVAEHAVSNGVTATSVNTYVHRYEDAVEDIRGRGFLGFAAHEISEPARHTTARFEFDGNPAAPGISTYPLLGLPTVELVTVTHPNGTVHRRRVARTYEARFDQAKQTYAPILKTLVSEADETAKSGATTTLSRESSTYDADAFGNVTKVVTRLGNGERLTSTRTYDVDEGSWLISRLTKLVDTSETSGGRATRTTALGYDAAGELATAVIEPGVITATEIKPLPQPQPDGMSTLFIRFRRDPATGNVTRIAYDAEREPSAAERATEFFFDDPDRIVPTRTVNKRGHVVRVAVHPGFGFPVAQSDPDGRVARWRYDPFGRLKQVIPIGGDSQSIEYLRYSVPDANLGRRRLELKVSSASGHVGRARLDHLGRPLTLIDYGRDDNRGVESNWTYDAWGQVADQSRPHFEGTAANAFDSFEFDRLGRLTKATAADGIVRARVYRGLELDEFDADPNDPVALHTTSTYDPGGRLLSVVQHLPATAERPARDLAVSYAYGPFGVLLRARGAQPNEEGSTTTYDRRGRIVTRTDAARGKHEFGYSVFGEVATERVTDAKGTSPAEVRQRTYDDLGRVSTITTRDGTTRFTWDTSQWATGALASVESPDGTVTALSYDAVGRLAKQTWKLRGGSYAIGTAHDLFGRVERIDYPDQSGRGFSVAYRYGPHGALGAIVDATSNAPYWKQVETTAAGPINPSGRFPRAELGNGVVTELVENTAQPGRQRRVEASRGNTWIQRLAYESDKKLNLRSREDQIAGVTETFEYDAANRLHHATTGANGAGVRFDYDDLNNLRRIADETAPSQSVTFSYGPNAEVGPFAITATSKAPPGDPAWTYDSDGNQRVGPGRRVTFTAFGLPRRIETATGAHDFTYDGFGNRVSRRSSDTDETVTLGDLYERQTRTRSTQIFTIHGPTGPVAEVVRPLAPGGEDQLRYLHVDQVGSVVAVSDRAGAVVEKRTYDPFGKLVGFEFPGHAGAECKSPAGCSAVYRQRLDSLGRAASSRGFAGGRTDFELGLVQMGARFYDPALGRFLSPDPLDAPGSVVGDRNPYAYAANNPVSYSDPLGLDEESGGFAGSGWSFVPSDPPPGPWINTPASPVPIAPSDGSGFALPSAPYNPVNTIDGRAATAAAKVDYRGGGARTVGLRPGWSQRRALDAVPPAYERSPWNQFCDYTVDHPYDAGATIFLGVAAVGVVVVAALPEIVTVSTAASAPTVAAPSIAAAPTLATVAPAVATATPAVATATVVVARTAPSASWVWSLNPFQRGQVIDLLRGNNLGQFFPNMDRLTNGVVTSIKSLDLAAKTYQYMPALNSTVTRYINQISRWTPGAELELVVPFGRGTPQQFEALYRLVQYGASIGVDVKIIFF